MTILNYTSDVAVEKTIGEIHGILVQHGALEIRTRYANRLAVGVDFVIDGKLGVRSYILPIYPEKTYARMTREWNAGGLPGLKRAPDIEQARRTAWRNLRAYLLVLFDQIDTGALEFEEAMFGYLEQEPGRSVYQIAAETHQRALAAGKGRD